MDNDLISRSALLEEFGEEPLVWDGRDREQVQECNDWEWYTGLVKAAPAVDAVIPVRCKDCKHGRKSDHAYAVDTAKPLCECNFMYRPHQWHEYCSWGERRSDNV